MNLPTILISAKRSYLLINRTLQNVLSICKFNCKWAWASSTHALRAFAVVELIQYQCAALILGLHIKVKRKQCTSYFNGRIPKQQRLQGRGKEVTILIWPAYHKELKLMLGNFLFQVLFLSICWVYSRGGKNKAHGPDPASLGIPSGLQQVPRPCQPRHGRQPEPWHVTGPTAMGAW